MCAKRSKRSSNQDDQRPTARPKICRSHSQSVRRRHRQIPVAGLSQKGRLGAAGTRRNSCKNCARWIPNVTGTPVQLLEYTTLSKTSFQEAACYSLGAIVILVLHPLPQVLVASFLPLIPVGIGSLWMVGFMGIFDIPFNPANIMTLPLIIGIGVTNGIHILNRFAEEQHPSILAKSTGKAVLVSGLTTIAGFGSLILAKHRGIRSLGFIMSIGRRHLHDRGTHLSSSAF